MDSVSARASIPLIKKSISRPHCPPHKLICWVKQCFTIIFILKAMGILWDCFAGHNQKAVSSGSMTKEFWGGYENRVISLRKSKLDYKPFLQLVATVDLYMSLDARQGMLDWVASANTFWCDLTMSGWAANSEAIIRKLYWASLRGMCSTAELHRCRARSHWENQVIDRKSKASCVCV